MSPRTEKWLYGLGAATISGGAASVVSGLMTMGFAPDKFNLVSLSGFLHLLFLIAANFLISGLLGMFLYLRQAPLPPEGTGDTNFINKPQTSAPAQQIDNYNKNIRIP